jgi:hypothetical protein
MNWSWENFFVAIIVAIMAWLLYKNLRAMPQAFSKENLSKSFFTLGLLALGLILFIGLLVLFLKTG